MYGAKFSNINSNAMDQLALIQNKHTKKQFIFPRLPACKNTEYTGSSVSDISTFTYWNCKIK